MRRAVEVASSAASVCVIAIVIVVLGSVAYTPSIAAVTATINEGSSQRASRPFDQLLLSGTLS